MDDDHEAVLCENCDTWFHICCQGIPSREYSRLNNSSIIWACLSCHSQNYSHIRSGITYHNNNTYIQSDDTAENEDDLSIESLEDGALPKHESSPKVKKRTRNKVRPLKILNVNCQSIPSKIGAWRLLLNKHEPDVVVATETWLNPNIYDTEPEADDFVIYRRDRQTTIGGGVLIAVHKSINSIEVKIPSENAETVWAKLILTSQQNITIGACYRPNVSDKTTIPAMKRILDTMLNKQHRNIILAGDFNYPGWNWEDMELKPSCQHVNLHEDFKIFLNENGLVQEVKKPTRDANTLDLIATNIHKRVIRTEVLPGISDHSCVLMEISMRVNRRKQAPHKIWLYKRADWKGLSEHLETRLQTIDNNTTVKDSWNLIKRSIEEGIVKYIPSKMSKKRKSLPYISADLDRKMTLRDRLESRSKKKGGQRIEQRYKQLKRECQRQLRHEHYRFVENLLTEDDGQETVSKKFWAYLKQKRGDTCGIDTLREGDHLVTDSAEKAEVLNRQFHSVFTSSSQEPPSTFDNNDMPPISIAAEGVRSQLQKLNPYKATGPDNISPRVLKELADVLARPLAALFESSLNQATVPEEWKKARVTPLYKKGDKSLPSNQPHMCYLQSHGAYRDQPDDPVPRGN